MRYVEVETQGESKTAIVNSDQVAYLAESIYGTAIHFASGEYLICVDTIHEIAAKLFGKVGENAAIKKQVPNLMLR